MMKLLPGRSRYMVLVVLCVLGTKVVLAAQNADALVRTICGRAYIEGPTEEALQRETSQIVALGEPGRRALVKLARGKGHEGDRAMDFLLRLGDARAVEVARKILANSKATPELTIRALDAVAHTRDAASSIMVLALFRSHDDESVMRYAVRALARLEDKASLQALRKALFDPRYRGIRGDIVKAVGLPDHDEAVDLLARLLVDDPVYRTDEYARGTVMESLTRIGTLGSLTHAVAIAKTIDTTHLSGERRLHLLRNALRGRRAGSKDPNEVTAFDALVRDLEASVRKPN